MYFKIDRPGTDYTRVTMDVPNEQLTDVIRVITQSTEPATLYARSAWAAASGTLSEETRTYAQAVSVGPCAVLANAPADRA